MGGGFGQGSAWSLGGGLGEIWTQPPGCPAGPPRWALWQRVWALDRSPPAVGGLRGVPPGQRDCQGDALWPLCVPREWQRGGALEPGVCRRPPRGDSREGNRPGGPHPACHLSLCSWWGGLGTPAIFLARWVSLSLCCTQNGLVSGATTCPSGPTGSSTDPVGPAPRGRPGACVCVCTCVCVCVCVCVCPSGSEPGQRLAPASHVHRVVVLTCGPSCWYPPWGGHWPQGHRVRAFPATPLPVLAPHGRTAQVPLSHRECPPGLPGVGCPDRLGRTCLPSLPSLWGRVTSPGGRPLGAAGSCPKSFRSQCQCGQPDDHLPPSQRITCRLEVSGASQGLPGVELAVACRPSGSGTPSLPLRPWPRGWGLR